MLSFRLGPGRPARFAAVNGSGYIPPSLGTDGPGSGITDARTRVACCIRWTRRLKAWRRMWLIYPEILRKKELFKDSLRKSLYFPSLLNIPRLNAIAVNIPFLVFVLYLGSFVPAFTVNKFSIILSP